MGDAVGPGATAFTCIVGRRPGSTELTVAAKDILVFFKFVGLKESSKPAFNSLGWRALCWR